MEGEAAVLRYKLFTQTIQFIAKNSSKGKNKLVGKS